MTQPVHYHYGKFPPVEMEIIPLIGPASAALARYDGMLNAVPNPNVLLSPLATQEAVLSSKIEGTATTITEVLKFEAEGAAAEKSPAKAADIQEVPNYRKAMRSAVDALKDLLLCQRIIKGAHKILLEGVRGKGKAPGEYRRGPNFLFKTGLLSRPTFYISAFFERNREEYYDRLLAVSRAGAWTQWMVFFLKALRAQAEVNQIYGSLNS